MKTSLVLTLIGPDRTGLVRSVADVVSAHDGSWQESRMARLAGQFAGILRVECPGDRRASLEKDLSDLESHGLRITVTEDTGPAEIAGETLSLDIVGHDEAGIVKRISSTLASLGVNVEELDTSLESAPMAGHLLFRTKGKVRLPEGLAASEMITALEKVGADLTVDVR